MMNKGQLVKEWRERFGYTQDAFAKFVGVSQRTISNWENPKSGVIPRDSNLHVMAQKCGVSYADFMNGAKSHHKKTEQHEILSIEHQELKYHVPGFQQWSAFYILSTIQKQASMILEAAFCPLPPLFKSNEHYIEVFIDMDNQVLPVGTIAIIKTEAEPLTEDIVLIQINNKRTGFVLWDEKNPPENIGIKGVVVGQKII